MTQFKCHCGLNISLTACPNENSGSLIWDPEFEKWQDARSKKTAQFITEIVAGNKKNYIREFYKTSELENIDIENVIDDIIEKEDTYSLRVVHCNECGRIYVQEKPRTNKWKSYKPE